MHRGHLVGCKNPFALFGMLFLHHLNPLTESLLVLFLLGFLRFQHFLVLSSQFLGYIDFKVEAMFALNGIVIIFVIIEVRKVLFPTCFSSIIFSKFETDLILILKFCWICPDFR